MMDGKCERANSESSTQQLSLKVQEYLWQQVGNSLKVKLEAGKYEQTCVAFERLYRDRNKELKISIPEVYADIKSISRSTFIQGAFPYVIHCCAAILAQRRVLGLGDKLSVAVTKVFSTMHWILLEAREEVDNKLDFSSIELFVQMIIPNLYNLYERDLTFSLQIGISLWQPLWDHSPPMDSLLASPIVNPVCESTLSVGKTQPVITYFDVALLKVMMLTNWSFNGYRWGLRYIQRHLQLVLSYHGFNCDNSIVMDLLNLFDTKKVSNTSASVSQITVEFKENIEMNANTQYKNDSEQKNNLPKELHQFVTEEGELKLTFVVKILKKLFATETLVRLSGEMLFIIAQLIDISIDSYTKQQIKFEFESLLICLLNTIKMLGCDQCSTVLRGTKSDHLRSLAQIYLKKLLAHKEETAKAVVIEYVETISLSSAVLFFHSFMGYCTSSFGKRELRKPGALGIQDSFEVDPNTTTNYTSYLDNKGFNERLILKWTSNILIRKFMEDWDNVKASGRSELFTSVVQLVKYLQLQHHLVFRKIVMCGLLNSFDKSRHRRTMKSPLHETIVSSHLSPPDSPMIPNIPSLDGTGSIGRFKKVISTNKVVLAIKSAIKADPNESNVSGSSTTLPHTFPSTPLQRNDSMNSLDSTTTTMTTTATTKKEGYFTLPKAFMRNLGGVPLKEDVSLTTSLSEKSFEDVINTRGKLINCQGLHEGLRQLRCLLQVTAPGVTPEEAVVAAMLDLEAPVVARAAYLLELAHFVHLCNKNYWPCLVQFAPAQGGSPEEPDANMLKHRAGVLFHKWGVSIGRKLEDILVQEKVQTETNKSSLIFDEKSIEYMYQGDIKSVSQYCPHALRNVACQLLLEITAFLRESYVHIAAQASTPVESPSLHTKQVLTAVKSDASSKKKQSVASVIGRKISALPRRKQSSHLLQANPAEQSYSPGKLKKKQSGAARNRITRRTSLVQYHGHRRSSKTAGVERQTSISVNDIDENYLIDFPWLNIIIQMNKTTDHSCSHALAHSCLSSCPVSQTRSCLSLFDSLNTIYGSYIEEDHDMQNTRYREHQKSDPVRKYLNENVGSLSHIPYAVLCKGARVMDVSQLHETMGFSWEVLNYPDDKLKAAASSLFLISGVLFMQMESTISDFLMKQLTSVDVADRAKAVERLSTLWNYQYTVYDHLEDHDKRFLKIALPKVEFTVPSRPVGIEPQIAPDAPWLPNAQNFQDVDLSDDEDDFYFMDSEKQLEAKTKKRAKKLNDLKENYLVSAEPFTFQSIQKLAIFNNVAGGGEEDQSTTSYQKMKEEAMTIHWDCPVQSFFPESIEEGLLQLIRLLDDTTLTAVNNHSVSGLARQLIWKCMVDNPEIFFRRFLEKITVKQHQTELIMLLRKLLVHFPILPQHTARYLFNNLVGVVSLYNRTNRPYTQDKIAAIMPLFSLIAPSVTKIYFKELQMTLRREHVDDILMVTANGVCAKEIVLYPEKETLAVMETMTFRELLTQGDEDSMWLVDKHSGQIMEPEYRIRDVYTHKRGFPRPALKLERLDETYAFRKREKQALINKLINISQLEFCKSVFDALPNKRHVMFLYTELYQKASFPRKAIDIEFDLCAGVELGQEIFGMDVIYKDNWVEFISTLLKGLSSTLSFYGEEMINIFIDPINGALLLHCEDILILRSSLAALINVVICYEKTFSLHGFSEILPTILRVYSQHEGNQLVKEAIEFTIHQFFFIHGGSFILQMFASVAPILIPDSSVDMSPIEQVGMVPAKNLFNLLESLDKKHIDTLDILSLVENGDKIKPYADPVNEESDRSSIDLSIRLALTIISYKSESKRALQMMYVLSTLIPYYLNLLKVKKDGATEVDLKKEMKHMRYLIKYVATIIELYEHLRNSIHGVSAPDHSIEATAAVNVHWMWHSIRSTLSSWSQWFSSHGREERPEGDDMERASIIEEGENPIIISPSNVEQRKKLDEFYLPRTILLTLASDFTLNCTETYNSLRQTMHSDVSGKAQNGGFHDVIEDENSLILIDIAISMLKLVFLDHHVLRNPGLERFLIEAMPLINWKDNLEPFSVIIKRMTIIFKIIAEKPDYWKYLDWDGLENLIKGLYSTLKKQERIAEIPEIKDLIHTCLKVIIADVSSPPTESGISAGIRSTSSISFNNSIVKLSARLLYSHGEKFNLNDNFRRYIRQNDPLKVDRFLVHWLLPLAIRMGTGRFDYPRMNFENIEFISKSLISILVPKEVNRDPMSFLAKFSVQLGTTTETPPSLLNICFLGFKILLTVYPTSFGRHWKEIKKTIQIYMDKNESEILLWKFLSFVVSTRSTLLVYLLPKIQAKLSKIEKFDEPIHSIMSRIRSDLARPPVIHSRSLILHQILQELSILAHKDKENIRRGMTEEIDQVDGKSAQRKRENDDDVESDAAYINRVRRRDRTNQWQPIDTKSIMKQQSNLSENASFKKQVSFNENGAVSAIQLNQPGIPRRRRGGAVGVDIAPPIIPPEMFNSVSDCPDSPNSSDSPILTIRSAPVVTKEDNTIYMTNLDNSLKLGGNISEVDKLTMFPNDTVHRKLSSSRAGRRLKFKQKKNTPEIDDDDVKEGDVSHECEKSNVAADDEDDEDYSTLWNIKVDPVPSITMSHISAQPDQSGIVSNAETHSQMFDITVHPNIESKEKEEELSTPINSGIDTSWRGTLVKDTKVPRGEHIDSGIDTRCVATPEDEDDDYSTLWDVKVPPEVDVTSQQDVIVSNAETHAGTWDESLVDSPTVSKDKSEDSGVNMSWRGTLMKKDDKSVHDPDAVQGSIEMSDEQSFDSGVDNSCRGTYTDSPKLTISPFTLRRKDAKTKPAPKNNQTENADILYL